MKETDIRPRDLFERLLALCREDALHFFTRDEWQASACPACGGGGEEAFIKHGFHYRLCSACDTLYASPRPGAEAILRYYREARSARFLATDFYRQTEEARRERMFRPRARTVAALAERFGAGRQLTAVVDIGAGYGVFCEEIAALLPGAGVCAVEPAPALAQACRGKGLRVIESFLHAVRGEDLPGRPGSRVFTSFELLEHLHAPGRFLAEVAALMHPGDLLVLTTLSGAGFDIRVLWQHAKAVHPPHHLNFLNPASLAALAARCDLEVADIGTPGLLDVDIVASGLEAVNERFVRAIYRHAGEAARRDLQVWLSTHGLSSHMMLVARRALVAGRT
ncbi:MAG: class I SAM-dependent methyltransferase [Burkholderiales bacterium]|nr:class I SAM-dependent methyltransferase [Burkholderiales bacterium]